MDTADRNALRRRLSRIAGQVAGLQRMVEEDRYCVDILTQIAAVRSALDAVGVQLLTGHLQHCVAQRLDVPQDNPAHAHSAHPETDNRTTQELIEEVSTALSRFLR